MWMVAPVRVRLEGAYAVGLEPGPETAHEPLRAGVEEQADGEGHDTSLPRDDSIVENRTFRGNIPKHQSQ